MTPKIIRTQAAAQAAVQAAAVQQAAQQAALAAAQQAALAAAQTPAPATAGASIWEQHAAAGQAGAQAQTQVYLNVELEVAQGVFVRMPLNCPVSEDIRGMGANQRKLMEILLDKAEAAQTEEDLVIRCPVRLSLFVKGSNEPDATGWAI
ncbi:MAG: hypothetical protein [Podoviridae sp. ctLUJ1]|nr:MAG: hypothetical protein [Podoviridae sp. ctLUJ1]